MCHLEKLGTLTVAAPAAVTLLTPAAQAKAILGSAIDWSDTKIIMDDRECTGVLASQQRLVAVPTRFPANPTDSRTPDGVTAQLGKDTKLLALDMTG